MRLLGKGMSRLLELLHFFYKVKSSVFGPLEVEKTATIP